MLAINCKEAGDSQCSHTNWIYRTRVIWKC